MIGVPSSSHVIATQLFVISNANRLKLDLDTSNLVHRCCASYGLGIGAVEATATQLTLSDASGQHLDCFLSGCLGIDTYRFIYVKVPFAIKNPRALIDASSNTALVASDRTLNINNDFVSILGMFCKVGIEELERVGF